ncbi:phosphomethylpyrimidine synthase [Micractinium conductrix]|uniref:Phosphomethylpyrimidine synthase n=1 Tax=Micractinium conductrix TaxID=554055 RepID=A0A2P6VGB1_9CHLO|nr:phosphomethylpyrimidine synthase [Micractinium conductrix]PSC73111.1 phosphomethylpyrimidine synthase [Micractinium conductrix]|eukprot:PSC73038.1 phosphomethylpyrimidine synthase [Micractinium conductrix]
MPSPSDFRRAFGLGQGEMIGEHWLVTSSKVGHDVLEQNERYGFPTELTLEWQAGEGGTRRGGGSGKNASGGRRRRVLAAAFKQHTREPRVVYSAYGSPYECKYVGSPSVTALPLDGEAEEGAGAGSAPAPAFRLTCLGRAARRRDVPTRQQAAQAERDAKGQHELSKDEERRCLSEYRVIKSRFGSSRCALCGEAIDPGVKIAKRQGAGGRRGGSRGAGRLGAKGRGW